MSHQTQKVNAPRGCGSNNSAGQRELSRTVTVDDGHANHGATQLAPRVTRRQETLLEQQLLKTRDDDWIRVAIDQLDAGHATFRVYAEFENRAMGSDSGAVLLVTSLKLRLQGDDPLLGVQRFHAGFGVSRGCLLPARRRTQLAPWGRSGLRTIHGRSNAGWGPCGRLHRHLHGVAALL